MDKFQIKDSGQRQEFQSGMLRDVSTDKTLWHLVVSGPMLRRWAEHLTGGAKKYEADNWMKAEGEAELARFRESAFRHFMQWFLGDRDEDHAAAVLFNINGAEYVREKMRTKAKCDIEFPVETRMSAREFIANQKKGDGGTLPSL